MFIHDNSTSKATSFILHVGLFSSTCLILLSGEVVLSEWRPKKPQLRVQFSPWNWLYGSFCRCACCFSWTPARTSFSKFRRPVFRAVVLQSCMTHALSCLYFSLTSNYTLTPTQISGGKCDELSENCSWYLEKRICNFFPGSCLGHVDVFKRSFAVCSPMKQVKFWFLWKKKSVFLPFSDTGHSRLYVFFH